MLSIFNPIRDLTMLSVAIRMVLAFLSGAIIGAERSYKNRPAGFRTHILVCVAAATASMTGIYLYVHMQLPADISRIGAQVITGLGFLGGGTIIVTKDDNVKGLTTAAGLWASGIIGLAIGAGFYEGGIIGVLMIMVVEVVFSKVSLSLRQMTEFQVIIHYGDKSVLDQVMRYIKDSRIAITNLRITSDKDNDGNYLYTALLDARGNSVLDFEQFTQHVKKEYAVIDIEVVR